MRIKMKSTAAGPNGSKREGEIYDVADAEGQALIDGGYAEQVAEPVAEVAPEPAPTPAASAPAVPAVVDSAATGAPAAPSA